MSAPLLSCNGLSVQQSASAHAPAAGHLRDAVGVCARELNDPQLALFLARLLEPTPGPLLRHTLADELLPRAAFLYRQMSCIPTHNIMTTPEHLPFHGHCACICA